MSIPRPQPSGGFAWVQAPWGQVLQCGPLAAAADHFFTTRDLMLRDDDREWRQVAAHAGVPLEQLLMVRQVHGANVAVAAPDRPVPWTSPEADIIATDDPDVAVAVRTADCVAILLADETGRAVAAIHAGWRGLAARAPIAGVNALRDRFGIRPERLIVAIGPSIGSCCYEVGTDTRRAFVAAGHHPSILERWFEPRPGGKFHLDTPLAAREQLEGTGLPPSRIHVAGLCTRTHADEFHSYRAHGKSAGRMLAVIRPPARHRSKA